MKTFALSKLILGMLLAATVHAAPANAQATRTWVSGVGVDGGPCSRTAPCKTFAGAIINTLAGGEISVLDPGGYGAVTITKSVTINGEGTLASILAQNGAAITVMASATDKVILRNLQLNGASGGNSGVNVISGNVTIDKCMIFGFTSGFIGGMGVLINANSTTHVDIHDTEISYSSYGVWVATSSGFAVAALDNVRINGMVGYGLITSSNNAFATINRSYISNSGVVGVYTSSGNGVINVNDSVLTNNVVAVNASSSGSAIRLNNVALYDNTTALVTGGSATIATANNNKAAGNGGALTTSGTVTNF